jgi:hypothetical protein
LSVTNKNGATNSGNYSVTFAELDLSDDYGIKLLSKTYGNSTSVQNIAYDKSIDVTTEGKAVVIIYITANSNIESGKIQVDTSSGKAHGGEGSIGSRKSASADVYYFTVDEKGTYSVNLSNGSSGSGFNLFRVLVVPISTNSSGGGDETPTTNSTVNFSSTCGNGTYSVAYTTVDNSTVQTEYDPEELEGNSFTLTVTPDSGYDVDSVTLDGTPLTSTSTSGYVYKLSPTSETGSIVITYKEKATKADVTVKVTNSDNADLSGLEITAKTGDTEVKAEKDGDDYKFTNLDIDSTYELSTNTLEGYDITFDKSSIKVADGENTVNLTVSKKATLGYVDVPSTVTFKTANISGFSANTVQYYNNIEYSATNLGSNMSLKSTDYIKFKVQSKANVTITFDSQALILSRSDSSETTTLSTSASPVTVSLVPDVVYTLKGSNDDSSSKLKTMVFEKAPTAQFATYTDSTTGKNTFTLKTETDEKADKLLVTDLSMVDSLITEASHYGFIFISEETADNINKATDAEKTELCTAAYNADNAVLKSNDLYTEITNAGSATMTTAEGHYFGVGRITGVGDQLDGKYINFIPYVQYNDSTFNFGEVQQAKF